MTDQRSLGRLVAVHPIAPAAVQRAVFIAVLSFLFFLGMMFAYYLRQDIGYFLLSTAFLLIYLVMMFSIVMQRKSTVEVYENGIRFNKDAFRWEQVQGVSPAGEIMLDDKRKLQLPKSIVDFDHLVSGIRSRAGAD